jgi:RTA1 like protein
MSDHITPIGLVGFGGGANCTLELCSVQYSVFQYVPSLAANSTFLALFVISGFLHLYQGIRSKQWFYMTAAILGCITEVIGYVGRIQLHKNPFDFNDFLIQVGRLAA